MSRVMPDCEKPAPRQKTEKKNSEPMNMDLRPKRSAMLPKKRRREPAVRDVAAFIHVISAFVMPRSRPAKELMTVMEPVKKLVMATAIVTETINMHSWNVDVKQSGRELGSLLLIACERVVASSASVSASILLADDVLKQEHKANEENRCRDNLRNAGSDEARSDKDQKKV
jgi:hypothetical protein